MRAERVAEPLRIDGRLDEAVYARVPPMSDFIQNEPDEGSPANEKTDVWILFDDEHFYIVGRCWETEPARLVANEMRRDNFGIVRNDNFAWSIDTFFDRRNGFLFEVNPLGGRLDGQITNETQVNSDWNPIWEVRTAMFDGGWVMEAAIPFKSIRYSPGREQTWGLQVRRRSRWRNEISYLTPIPAALSGRGHFQVSLGAALTGLEAPPGSRNIEIKPYAIADLTSDLSATPAISNSIGGDGGIDVKYGVTQNLTADLTVNTDFAQVEADEQQVNLTRFSLFFPEKRESTSTPGSGEDDVSYRAQLDYRGDRYGVQLERLAVGTDFNPEVGFLRREDFERSFGSFRFSPRPRSLTFVRKLTWEGRFDYITSRAGVLARIMHQGARSR